VACAVYKLTVFLLDRFSVPASIEYTNAEMLDSVFVQIGCGKKMLPFGDHFAC